MEKKYYFKMVQSAEGCSFGYIALTKKEAQIVRKALDRGNWINTYYEQYSGYCDIDINNPIEIKE